MPISTVPPTVRPGCSGILNLIFGYRLILTPSIGLRRTVTSAVSPAETPPGATDTSIFAGTGGGFGAAQAAGLPISFHIGSGDEWDFTGVEEVGVRATIARIGANAFMANEKCIADLIFGGICARFPELDFVSVESGVGWLRFALDAFDWQWANGDVRKDHPDWDLTPSEYFQRQIYSCFWFEEMGLAAFIERYPDNVLYETDYPHPTSMSVGPASTAVHPREYASRVLADVSDETAGKVLEKTAAKLYGVEAAAV